MQHPQDKEPVESPYVPPETFDYNKYQDETTIPAGIEILKCLGRNAELLVFPHDASNEVIMDNMNKVAQELMHIVIDKKVPDADFQKLSDMLQQLPFQLLTIISRQKTEFERELLARYIGIRDPGTQRYSREFAGLGDMFGALIKLREQQGNKTEDYFAIVPKEEKE